MPKPIETPTTETPAEGAPSEGSVADALPTLPTQEQIENAFSEEQPGDAGQDGKVEGEPPKAEETKPPEGTPPETPGEDPDGDAAFENEFKDFKMPEGLKNRISKLTEQRNAEREALKGYEFFKPYANEKGQEYLKTLVDFDGLLEKAAEKNPWLGNLLRDVVIEGKPADIKAIQEAQGGQEETAPVGEPGSEREGDAPQDPRDKTLQDLQKWKADWEANQQKSAEEKELRELVDKEKEGYRAEIAEFEKNNAAFKGDKKFLRIALQNSAARNISFTDAAKELAEYMGGRETTQLKTLAKVDSEREGAAVETPGRGGTPVKSRPALGSDEERAQMLEQLGIPDD